MLIVFNMFFFQLASIGSPTILSPSRSFQSLSRSSSAHDASTGSSSFLQLGKSPATPASRSLSSGSSGSCSSSPSSSPAATSAAHQRPSSLHVVNPKPKSHRGFRSASRRKSVGHVPVSPLARTPSPSPQPVSPTQPPSPLVSHRHLHHHCPGASNTTQSYSPGSALTPPVSTSPSAKKCLGRPKSAEPGSPLLRRALSPDRLHPRCVENKAPPTISPLAAAPRVTVTSQPSGTRYTTEIGPPQSHSTETLGEPKSVPSESGAREKKATVDSSSEQKRGTETAAATTVPDRRDTTERERGGARERRVLFKSAKEAKDANRTP